MTQNVHGPQHTYVSSSYRFNRLGLSHWDPYAVRRGGCLELYYCSMVEWFWCDSNLISTTNWFPSVLRHCWFGHPAYKNRPRNDLLCVEWDVKPYTFTHSRQGLCNCKPIQMALCQISCLLTMYHPVVSALYRQKIATVLLPTLFKSIGRNFRDLYIGKEQEIYLETDVVCRHFLHFWFIGTGRIKKLTSYTKSDMLIYGRKWTKGSLELNVNCRRLVRWGF